MRSIVYTFAFFSVSLLLSGCSYQEYFTLVNRSVNVIEFSYLLFEPDSNKSLFNERVELFEENGNGFPNWSKSLSFVDLDTSANRIKINLPANSVLVFGTISNAHYDSKRRITTSGKLFNLSEIQLRQKGDVKPISIDEFHRHFKNDKGFYSLIIK